MVSVSLLNPRLADRGFYKLPDARFGKFGIYVEDECAAYVRYCFADPMDAAIFRSRFEPKSEPLGLRVEQSADSGRRPLQ